MDSIRWIEIGEGTAMMIRDRSDGIVWVVLGGRRAEGRRRGETWGVFDRIAAELIELGPQSPREGRKGNVR